MANFEWNELKRQKTLKARGLDFSEAQKAFEDDYAFSWPDPRYDFDVRWILIGRLNTILIVVIAYKELTPDSYRIISMREASRQEANRYEQEKQQRLPATDADLSRLLDQLIRDRKLAEEMDSTKQDASKRRQENS